MSDRKVSAWSMAVKEHIKAGGNFPRKGSADYDAVMKIKERMSPKDRAMDSAMKEPKKVMKAQTPRDRELERLGEEIAQLKGKLAGRKGVKVGHEVEIKKEHGHDVLSVAHTVPLERVKNTKKHKIPIGDADE